MKPAALGLLLAPGAGADRNQATLVALDSAASRAGVAVERMDFPYRRAGRRAPDKPAVLMEAVRAEATALSARCRTMVLGGRSMGGRMCSMAVADGLGETVSVSGLLLISYPLHPPGRPEKQRRDHFPALEVPCLFISGTRDAFGTPDELKAACAAIPGPVTHHFIDGKDHSMRGADAVVTELAVDWLTALQGQVPARR